ncbi:unnamed protein product [Clonostachys solani]|uniref:Uncharacterized protein n=1 Tax=Clonostachys solani TaxID=160281 RepID=A0A9N9ZCC6_9HYPO|nr:unnamed protein product [Clonostachys solani]
MTSGCRTISKSLCVPHCHNRTLRLFIMRRITEHPHRTVQNQKWMLYLLVTPVLGQIINTSIHKLGPSQSRLPFSRRRKSVDHWDRNPALLHSDLLSQSIKDLIKALGPLLAR